jgi:hypothetical protein
MTMIRCRDSASENYTGHSGTVIVPLSLPLHTILSEDKRAKTGNLETKQCSLGCRGDGGWGGGGARGGEAHSKSSVIVKRVQHKA